ncbi:tetratricopeptide repeat protein [Undibacterium sp. Di27W]|uniref:tetratricopeptide repeat protein n=1 Tax=Undibacterium sp. Di27W TaxID=3413036 RepID=UPI003BF2B047
MHLLISGSLIFLVPAWAQESQTAATEEAASLQSLNEGAGLIKAGKAQEAIPYFDKVIATYANKYRDSQQKIFCAHSPTEVLAYLLEAANQGKGGATVISSNWADAYYMKAFALVSQRQFAQARQVLQNAINLSPGNSQYRSELGHIYQQERNWELALSSFELAETNARSYSLAATQNTEIAQAMRGKAYVLVEQGKLDEAEQIYLQCLEMDKGDVRARNELTYVRQQKSKLR